MGPGFFVRFGVASAAARPSRIPAVTRCPILTHHTTTHGEPGPLSPEDHAQPPRPPRRLLWLLCGPLRGFGFHSAGRLYTQVMTIDRILISLGALLLIVGAVLAAITWL